MSDPVHDHADKSVRPTVGRRALLGAGTAVVAGTAAVLLPSGAVSAGGWHSLQDEADIRQLSINYALGTDSISAGNKPRALDYYSRTFSPDALITAGFDPAAPALVANGPAAWADVVENAFQPYSATQHLLGTINVDFGQRGGGATMSTYLHATHVFKAPSMDLLTVLGTYIDTVEQQRRTGWRIVKRFLQFTSFETSQRTAP